MKINIYIHIHNITDTGAELEPQNFFNGYAKLNTKEKQLPKKNNAIVIDHQARKKRNFLIDFQRTIKTIYLYR